MAITTPAPSRRRSKRLELRTTAEERALIDHAAQVKGGDLTEFVISSAVTEARRVLADRTTFVLDEQRLKAWESVNAKPAKELAGLRELMERPSPFNA